MPTPWVNLKLSSPQERLGFCIPRSAFRIPVFVRGTFGFWIPIVNGILWDSAFEELYSGFLIPQAKFSRIPDSISKKVQDSRMEIPLHGVSKRSISTKLRENRERYSLRETMDSVSLGSVIPCCEKNLDRWGRSENYFAIFLSVWQVSAVHKQQTRDKTNLSPAVLRPYQRLSNALSDEFPQRKYGSNLDL